MNIRKLVKESPIIVDAYNSGQTLRDLALQFNVSTGTIRTVLKRAGVVMRQKGRRRNVVQVTNTEV